MPFCIGVYLLLIDTGVLKDKTGHDEFYEWVRENRFVFLVGALLLFLFAA